MDLRSVVITAEIPDLFPEFFKIVLSLHHLELLPLL